MACSGQQYFVGNGEILIRKIAGDCGGAEESFRKVGDANELMINVSQDFGTHFESYTGNRTQAARWVNSTEANFTMSIQNFSIENLNDLFLGTNSGAVAAGSVVDETVSVLGTGWVFVDYQGLTSVNVTSNGGVTTLVAGVDYDLDARNGGINILDMTNVTNNTIQVDYSHVGTEGIVNALKNNAQEYEVRFNGVNLTSPNKPVIVRINRAQFSAAEEFSVIGQENLSLSFTGALLPDINGDFFDVQLSNAVA